MLIYNGKKCETIEQLLEEMKDLSSEQQQFLINDFNGNPNPVSVAIPQISAKQIRLALLGFGVDMTQIEQAMDQLQEPQKSYAKITWEYATVFEREHPLVDMFGQMLGFSSEQIDQMFLEGSRL